MGMEQEEQVEQVEQEPGLRAAAIVDDGSLDVDALLVDIARVQRQAGRRVRGLVMTRPDQDRSCASPMVLVDVHTQQAYLVSQALGRDSNSCRADPQGFARASEVLRRAVHEAPQLVICNRFGGLEAEGAGFRAELLDILMNELPLLTVVATHHVAAWLDFTGGAELLPAQNDAISAWMERTLGVSANSALAPTYP